MGMIVANKKFSDVKPGSFYRFTLADKEEMGLAITRISSHLCSAVNLVSTPIARSMPTSGVMMLTVTGDIVYMQSQQAEVIDNITPMYKTRMLAAKKAIVAYIDEVKALYGMSSGIVKQGSEMVLTFYKRAEAAIDAVRHLGGSAELFTTQTLHDTAQEIESKLQPIAQAHGMTLSVSADDGCHKELGSIRIAATKPTGIPIKLECTNEKKALTEYKMSGANFELQLMNTKYSVDAKRWGISWYIPNKFEAKANELLMTPLRNAAGHSYDEKQSVQRCNCSVNIRDFVEVRNAETEPTLMYTVVMILELGNVDEAPIVLDEQLVNSVVMLMEQHI